MRVIDSWPNKSVSFNFRQLSLTLALLWPWLYVGFTELIKVSFEFHPYVFLTQPCVISTALSSILLYFLTFPILIRIIQVGDVDEDTKRQS